MAGSFEQRRLRVDARLHVDQPIRRSISVRSATSCLCMFACVFFLPRCKSKTRVHFHKRKQRGVGMCEVSPFDHSFGTSLRRSLAAPLDSPRSAGGRLTGGAAAEQSAGGTSARLTERFTSRFFSDPMSGEGVSRLRFTSRTGGPFPKPRL